MYKSKTNVYVIYGMLIYLYIHSAAAQRDSSRFDLAFLFLHVQKIGRIYLSIISHTSLFLSFFFFFHFGIVCIAYTFSSYCSCLFVLCECTSILIHYAGVLCFVFIHWWYGGLFFALCFRFVCIVPSSHLVLLFAFGLYFGWFFCLAVWQKKESKKSMFFFLFFLLLYSSFFSLYYFLFFLLFLLLFLLSFSSFLELYFVCCKVCFRTQKINEK